ncbi:hypothetical protein JTE90_025869 [Oedothorax gibbosus]|uniref:Uncharacterized protein n=1 Tax=Oedothorax gibbosus TaxID=931172 RepID=A0AAV6UL99_9ARAC|nr:hypothetical protein JTE90_025869 [Oedothorax gibbosus]
MSTSNRFSTSYQIEYGWNYFLSAANNSGKDSQYIGFLPGPEKYMSHRDSTYQNHYEPKTDFQKNLSIHNKGPISSAYTSDRSKHLVSTNQYDYDGRRNATFTGGSFLAEKSCCCIGVRGERKKGDPEELLTSIGAVPLVKRCRNMQNWNTTYETDFIHEPIQRKKIMLPEGVL